MDQTYFQGGVLNLVARIAGNTYQVAELSERSHLHMRFIFTHIFILLNEPAVDFLHY